MKELYSRDVGCDDFAWAKCNGNHRHHLIRIVVIMNAPSILDTDAHATNDAINQILARFTGLSAKQCRPAVHGEN
jgi:hypothetical protein